MSYRDTYININTYIPRDKHTTRETETSRQSKFNVIDSNTNRHLQLVWMTLTCVFKLVIRMRNDVRARAALYCCILLENFMQNF